jgi:hypothetical protein
MTPGTAVELECAQPGATHQRRQHRPPPLPVVSNGRRQRVAGVRRHVRVPERPRCARQAPGLPHGLIVGLHDATDQQHLIPRRHVHGATEMARGRGRGDRLRDPETTPPLEHRAGTVGQDQEQSATHGVGHEQRRNAQWRRVGRSVRLPRGAVEAPGVAQRLLPVEATEQHHPRRGRVERQRGTAAWRRPSGGRCLPVLAIPFPGVADGLPQADLVGEATEQHRATAPWVEGECMFIARRRSHRRTEPPIGAIPQPRVAERLKPRTERPWLGAAEQHDLAPHRVVGERLRGQPRRRLRLRPHPPPLLTVVQPGPRGVAAVSAEHHHTIAGRVVREARRLQAGEKVDLSPSRLAGQGGGDRQQWNHGEQAHSDHGCRAARAARLASRGPLNDQSPAPPPGVQCRTSTPPESVMLAVAAR